ncbi:MAG TPA: hypothetical protein VJN18_06545 [Polyangiaceae bacterium]|nr:hypothetical protein [Polyangiaceae bacterium]
MGNFSRDPDARLADALGKHHVAVRLQQGVPLLDADWNALDDLRRSELEDIGRQLLGSGVPFGSDGFRIVPIAGGGVGTLVLRSASVGTGPSSLRVDLVASTAATALGFGSTNASSARLGSSPASLTGHLAEPFTLVAGSTLALVADGGPAETVTFQSGDFVDIAAAGAAEVASAINAAMARASAAVGAGNDFIIRGGGGTSENAGRIFVDGRMVLNESDLKYSEQALFENAALAALWNVSTVGALASSNQPHTVFLDAWHREVNGEEDPALVDVRIGVETSTRLRREWAVRVVPSANFPATVATRPPAHAYYALAEITRSGTGSVIDAAALRDLRDLDLGLHTGVAFRDLSAAVVVDSAAFQTLLEQTSSGIRDFLNFLGTVFVPPTSAYTAGETAGMLALAAVADIAEQGVTLLGARSLDTRGALALMARLRLAEERFVAVWRTGVLPLLKSGSLVYEIAYKTTVDEIDALLKGPPPIGLMTLEQALEAGSLLEAVRTQQRINQKFGEETPHATGTLLLLYLGSLTPTIVRNTAFDLRYRLTGTVTPADAIDVNVTLGAGWTSSLKNGDGTVPLNLSAGPGTTTREFIVAVQPPDLPASETDISVGVAAHSNPGGLAFLALPKHLRITDPPPPSDESFSFGVGATNVPLVGGAFRVPVSPITTAHIPLRLRNNTDSLVNVDLEPDPATSATWQITQGPFVLSSQPVPAHGLTEFLWHFKPSPATAGKILSFTLRARNASTTALLAQTTITLVSV